MGRPQPLSDDRQNFVLLTMPAEYAERAAGPQNGHRFAVGFWWPWSRSMASGVLPNADAALLAALAMVAGGCVRLDRIYRVISWTTVVVVAGMLPLATALSKTGATTLMAHDLVKGVGSLVRS